MIAENNVEQYLSLPYTVQIIPQMEEDGTTYFAKVQELPGCMTEADSYVEAAEMIQDAMRGWIEIALEDGREIPQPKLTDDYSGKFVVRLPRSLHRDVAMAAEQDAVSLNQFIVTTLARQIGAKAL